MTTDQPILIRLHPGHCVVQGESDVPRYARTPILKALAVIDDQRAYLTCLKVLLMPTENRYARRG